MLTKTLIEKYRKSVRVDINLPKLFENTTTPGKLYKVNSKFSAIQKLNPKKSRIITIEKNEIIFILTEEKGDFDLSVSIYEKNITFLHNKQVLANLTPLRHKTRYEQFHELSL